MAFCPHCGSQLASAAAFCASCGGPLAPPNGGAQAVVGSAPPVVPPPVLPQPVVPPPVAPPPVAPAIVMPPITPNRSTVRLGAVIAVGGAILGAVAAFLPWIGQGGVTSNGLDAGASSFLGWASGTTLVVGALVAGAGGAGLLNVRGQPGLRPLLALAALAGGAVMLAVGAQAYLKIDEAIRAAAGYGPRGVAIQSGVYVAVFAGVASAVGGLASLRAIATSSSSRQATAAAPAAPPVLATLSGPAAPISFAGSPGLPAGYAPVPPPGFAAGPVIPPPAQLSPIVSRRTSALPLQIAVLAVAAVFAFGGGLAFGPQLVASVGGGKSSPSAPPTAAPTLAPKPTPTSAPKPTASPTHGPSQTASPAPKPSGSATPRPTATPTPSPKASSQPTAPSFATPEALLQAAFELNGWAYGGQCPGTSHGSNTYCWTLLGQRADGSRVYAIGPLNSESAGWVLLRHAPTGWVVGDSGPFPGSTLPPGLPNI